MKCLKNSFKSNSIQAIFSMYYTFLIDRGKRFYSEEMQKVFHKKGGKPDKIEPFFKHRLEEAWS